MNFIRNTSNRIRKILLLPARKHLSKSWRRLRRRSNVALARAKKFLQEKFQKETLRDIYLKIEADLNGLRPDFNDKLVALGHSRPALDVRAPAFFRHAIFFFPHERREKKNPTLHPGTFNRALAMTRLGALVGRFTDTTQTTIAAELEKHFKNDQSFVLSLGDFRGFDLRCLVDIYTEYATLTFCIDNYKSAVGRSDISIEPIAIANYIRNEIDAQRKLVSKEECGRWFQADYGPSEAIFFGVWDLLYFLKRTTISRSEIGTMVGDFCGFAISPKISDPNIVAKFPADRDQASLKIPLTFDLIKFLSFEQKFFMDCLGLDEKGMIKHVEEAAAKRIEPNIILSQMLDGSAIYGSALGNPLTRRSRGKLGKGDPLPITYFTIYNGDSVHQLGRLIRRLHLIGELRLAALLDAETIIKLGSPLRRLSGLVSNLLNDGTGRTRLGKREFNAALQLYSRIGNMCHGGFLYRMARASYYYDALQVRIADVRAERIRGWQSYPDFMNRHFDQRFRSMRSTGERYVEVGKRIQRLFALYGTARSVANSGVALLFASIVGAFGLSAAFYSTLKDPTFRTDEKLGAALILFLFIVISVMAMFRFAETAIVQGFFDRGGLGLKLKYVGLLALFVVLAIGGVALFNVLDTTQAMRWIDRIIDVFLAPLRAK